MEKRTAKSDPGTLNPLLSALRTPHSTLRTRKRGFTLLEAMAAVVLLGIGIVGATTAFKTLIQTEDRARQTEKMQRLAEAKLAELVALGQATTSADGDFTDQNEPDYTWNLEANSSGVTDLDAVSLTVTQTNGSKNSTTLDTLIYVPPTTTTTGGTGGGTGG